MWFSSSTRWPRSRRSAPGLRDLAGKGKLDRDRVAVSGHSAGALTAQMAIGAKTRTLRNPQPTDLGDKRFKAAIVISGPGTNNLMFTDHSWADLDKPMLVITGSLDSMALTRETPETRQEPFTLAKPGSKYLLFVQGATHGSYAGKTMTAVLGEKPSSDIGMITGATAQRDAGVLGRVSARPARGQELSGVRQAPPVQPRASRVEEKVIPRPIVRVAVTATTTRSHFSGRPEAPRLADGGQRTGGSFLLQLKLQR